MVILDHIDSEQSQEDYVHIIRSLCGDNILVPGNVIIAGRMSVEMKIGDLKLLLNIWEPQIQDGKSWECFESLGALRYDFP